MRAVRGGRIGMIFQEPATSLNPVMRVGDQIVEAIEAHTALRGAAARAKAIEWLGRVGIPEPERRIDEYPFRLSGGQKQRVMIAMTLASEPDFLIADEPTTALDVTIQAQILDLLKDLQREQGMGLLLITHDLAVVAGMADRVALMYAGQIIEVADAADFFAAPKHPYARLLLQALARRGRRGEPLAAIRGSVPPLWLAFDGCRFTPRCDRAFGACPTTPPALIPLGASRSVRCLLYTDLAPPARGGPAEPPAGRLVSCTASAGRLRPAVAALRHQRRHGSRGRRSGRCCSRSWTSPFAFRSGAACCSERPASSAPSTASRSIVSRGQTLALVGESGCGKTTTGKAIVQLLRNSAVIEGSARLEGHDLFELEGQALREARGARSRSSSRTRSPRSTRACGCGRSSRRA